MVDGWSVGWTGRLFQRLIVSGLGGPTWSPASRT